MSPSRTVADLNSEVEDDSTVAVGMINVIVVGEGIWCKWDEE